MDAITGAKEKLARAREKLEGMRSAPDPPTVIVLWAEFLVEAQKVTNKLDHLKGLAFAPLLQRLRSTRQSDPLLIYIREARNADEHGLGAVALLKGPSVSAGEPGKAPMVHGIEVSPGMKVAAVSFNGKPLELRPHGPNVALQPIRVRGVGLVQPPTKHLGQPLQKLFPITVAELAITYLTAAVEEAALLANQVDLGSHSPFDGRIEGGTP